MTTDRGGGRGGIDKISIVIAHLTSAITSLTFVMCKFSITLGSLPEEHYQRNTRVLTVF